MWKRHSKKESSRERDEESDCLSVMGSPVNSDDLNFKPVTPFVKRTEITDSATKTKTTVQTRLEQNLKIDVSDTESQEPHEKIATRKNRISKIPKKRKKTLSDTQSLKKLSFSKKACKTQQNPVKELGTNSVLQKEVLEYPTLPCSEDVNPTPGFEEENVKSQEITLDTELVRNKESAGKAYKPVSSSQPVNFRNKSFRTPVFCEDAKYVSMLSAEFENSYQCEEESPHQRVSRPMRAIPSPNKNNNTELHMINFKKTVYNTTASAVSTESSHIGTIGSKPEPVIEPNWGNLTVDLQSLLNTCENLECRKRDIHQVPTESMNLDSQRGQELCSAFIKHIPLLVELMWGRSKQISTHNRHVLIGQLLQAIRVVLNVDIGGAVAFLLHKATTCFHKHYKMINEILVNIRHKDCDNVMEVVDVLLSVGDFRWPLWFQIRVFTNMKKHETNFDYKVLSRYLNAVLYNKLLIHFEKLEVGGMHVPINSKSSEFASTIKCSDGKSCIIPLPTKSVEDHMLLSKQTIDQNSKSSEFASTMYRTDGKSSTITTEQPHSRQSIHQQLVPIARGSQVAQQPNGCKQIAQQITENLVSKNVEKALTILNNCKAEQLYEVAHNIIIGHAAEYGRVVNVLMDYFKERRCMHLLMKNFDTFLSIVGFNLVVKLLNDEKKEEACNLFDQIINAGLEYLNVQVFTEILGGTENPSPMKNVLIAADLFLNSDNYDKAAKLLFDNCLVGDSCKWKGTTQLDIKLRNKCIESVFNVFIEDSRPAVTMLACQLFSEMQQQNCPFAFDEDRVIKVLRKLLSISALNKLTYDIFKKYFMTASDSSKSYLVIHGAPICRAMIVISHSCDPDFCPILLQEFLKLYVYPNWQILDGGTITVQTNWLTIEIQLLFEDFVQRLVALRSRKAFLGLALPKQIRVVLEESANEDAIMALNVDVSHDAAINRLQEIFFSLLPRVRTLLDNGQLITIREDWTNYFHEQYNKAKLGIN